ncbi:GPI inositol-deacylase [Pseudonocardia kujensis]|uniref:esterase/lipase family protein n=1 Tax=Pseudonocardia kujensis TaxID=1128675 RepID=UPI001E581FE5|nr:GPI inositol-deacylase [Pseudonocardia kujensis]MCE0767547.1 GPI inositol-deacylase [Pseudonocardia kujensis]
MRTVSPPPTESPAPPGSAAPRGRPRPPAPLVRVATAVLVVVGLVFGLYAALSGASLRSPAAAPEQPPAAPVPAAPAWAPVDRPGPALTVPAADLTASLVCTRGRANRDTVLLLSGTGADPDTAFGWGLRPLLAAQGFPTCLSTAPDANTGDVARRAEYVVYAIRTIAERTGRKVAVVGHSQGGMVPRWALRFWPDVRAQVSDLVALGPTNAGSDALRAGCARGCTAAFWQQSSGSRFEEALNSGRRTFPGVDYTVVVSTGDTVVTPVPQASALPAEPGGGAVAGNGAGNGAVAVQDVCPGRTVEHGPLGLSDAAAFALVVDALGNPGPADPARIAPSTCARAQAPGITAAELRQGTAAVDRAVAQSAAAGAVLSAEPDLPCYTRPAPC